VAGWPSPAIWLALFVVVAVITQFMSDAATTALVAPMAVGGTPLTVLVPWW
jgi:di/tricarboxylate transporter